MLNLGLTSTDGEVNGCSVADYNSGESAGIVSPVVYTQADKQIKIGACPVVPCTFCKDIYYDTTKHNSPYW